MNKTELQLIYALRSAIRNEQRCTNLSGAISYISGFFSADDKQINNSIISDLFGELLEVYKSKLD